MSYFINCFMNCFADCFIKLLYKPTQPSQTAGILENYNR